MSIAGSTYQTNVFNYTNSQITKVVTTDYQSNLLTTRFEYTGDNISKVYQQVETVKEYLYYEIPKFDDKTNLYPDVNRYLGLGLVGIIDGFSYLNKKNPLSEKYYSETGIANYTQDNVYDYNATNQPTKMTATINNGGTKGSAINTYQYNCK